MKRINSIEELEEASINKKLIIASNGSKDFSNPRPAEEVIGYPEALVFQMIQSGIYSCDWGESLQRIDGIMDIYNVMEEKKQVIVPRVRGYDIPISPKTILTTCSPIEVAGLLSAGMYVLQQRGVINVD